MNRRVYGVLFVSMFFVGSFLLKADSEALAGDQAVAQVLMDEAMNLIQQDVVRCGLATVSGLDPRLPAGIRARVVDQVVVQLRGPQIVPYLLIDKSIKFNYDREGTLNFEVMDARGVRLWEIGKTFHYDDLYVETGRFGRIAYSKSSHNSQGLLRWYYLNPPGHGARQVSGDEFVSYIRNELFEGFSREYFCH